MPTRHIIIGGGVAGTVAAETLREIDRSCEVTIVSEEPVPLYNRCSLPHVLRRATTRESVFLRTLGSYSDAGIKVLWGRKVIRIDTDQKRVTTDDGCELVYDKLLVATGGTPNRLTVPGAMHERVNYFQFLTDLDQLDRQMDEATNAVVLGGSFIAYELCEACVARGIPVTWITRGPWFLHRHLDEEAGRVVDAIAVKNGAKVIHGEEVNEVVHRDGSLSGVRTKAGNYFDAGLLGCGLGLKMNIDFLRDTPVKTEKGVVVNEYLESSVPGIFAAGDVAESYYPLLGDYGILANWNKAIDQARTAARNMAGLTEKYSSVPVYVSGLFDSRIMLIGLPDASGRHLQGLAHSDPRHHRYRKLYFSGRQLAGAVLIGDFRGWNELRGLVETRAPVVSPESLV